MQITDIHDLVNDMKMPDPNLHPQYLITAVSGYEDVNRDNFETPGDLEEFEKILHHEQVFQQTSLIKESPLKEASDIWNFVNAAQMVCRPEDLRNIPSIRDFISSYPKLYRTMEVWAWG